MKTFAAFALCSLLTLAFGAACYAAGLGGLATTVLLILVGVPAVNWVAAKATGVNIMTRYLR